MRNIRKLAIEIGVGVGVIILCVVMSILLLKALNGRLSPMALGSSSIINGAIPLHLNSTTAISEIAETQNISCGSHLEDSITLEQVCNQRLFGGV